jgi:primosomal protein N' (replication factor Y)
MYADVVFPQKLKPLTYKLPSNAPENLIGMIVSAPLGGKTAKGVIVSESPNCNIKNIKEIASIHHRGFSINNITFLLWLSEYYMTPAGIALKSLFFDEIVAAIDIQPDNIHHDDSAVSLKNSSENAANILKSVKSKTYKTFLFHAASEDMERNLLLETLNAINPDNGSIIILAPEITHIKIMQQPLFEIFGDRLCILHSRLTKKKRSAAINGIISGKTPVVLGTRSAILSPFNKIALIAVMHEHSPSYKAEEGLRYNARDAAVMRGFMEKSCVLLSSVCPSVESIYNAKIGKYSSIAASSYPSVEKRPKLKIVDTTKNRDAAISPEIIRNTKKTIEAAERALFLINKKGYSLLRCEDCGSIAECEKCKIPAYLFKGKQSLKCGLCGKESPIPESCAQCKSYKLIPFGAGTERIMEELSTAISSKAVLIEKQNNKQRGNTLPQDREFISNELAKAVVGTNYVSRKMSGTKFTLGALLNEDLMLSAPDFRANEKAFQEIIQAAQMIQPEGVLYIQTWNPKNKFWQFVKNYDFNGFYNHELSQRTELNYPPFSRIILIEIVLGKKMPQINKKIIETVENINAETVEIWGPIEAAYKDNIHQIVLKSKDRKALHNTADSMLKELNKIKGIKIKIDVDPLKI